MADNKKIFSGSDDNGSDDGAHRRPILENNNQGAAAWLHRDKNDNAYISVRLPLGLGNLNLFAASDQVSDALNQLADYLEEQDEE